MDRPKCKHCGRNFQTAARGLCKGCYYRPGVREIYPAMPRALAGAVRRNRPPRQQFQERVNYAVVAYTSSAWSGDLLECVGEFKAMKDAERCASEVAAVRPAIIEKWTDFRDGGLGRSEVVATFDKQPVRAMHAA